MSISVHGGARGFGAIARRCVPLLITCSIFGCRGRGDAEPGEAQVVTEVAALRPAAAPPEPEENTHAPELSLVNVAAAHRPPTSPSGVPKADGALEPDGTDDRSTFCRAVEAQARDTNAALPQKLDATTSATRVVAYGCDVIMEYVMLDVSVDEISSGGVGALFEDVVQKVCSDGGARGVLDRGGSFTNVYRDRAQHLIDQFTIGSVECARAATPPDAARPEP